MSSKKIDNHVRMSKDIYDKLSERIEGNFEKKVDAIEYYLEMGMKYEDTKSTNEKILYDLNCCIKDIKYVKKLMEQYMANKGFPANKKINEDKCIIDFRKNIYRDDFND